MLPFAVRGNVASGETLGGSNVAGIDGAARHSDSVAEKAAPAALPYAFSLAILFLTYWCVDIVSPALPAIQQSLALSATGAGLVFSVFFAGRLASNVPAAWMVGRIGPKWTAVVGATALLIGSTFAAMAGSEPVLLAARAVQGGGVAVLATAGLLSALRARPERGAAMTAFNVSTGVGGSGGLLTGGLLTAELGWRAIFWLCSGISALMLAGSLVTRGKGQSQAMPEAMVDAEPGMPATGERSLTGQAAAVTANFLVFCNYAIWVVALPLLATVRFGFDPGQIGLLLLYVNLVHVVSAVPAGRAVRATGSTRALAVGYGITGLGLLLVPFVPSPLWLAAPMALYGIGQMAGNIAAGDLILRLGGGGGRAVGAVRLSADIGLVAGPAAAGALADSWGVQAPFVVLGGAALVAMTLSGAIDRRQSGWSFGRG
jgi:MFS family permease